MCTRFFMEMNPELQEIADQARKNPLTERINMVLSKPLCSSGEIHPTDLVPVIAPTPKGARGVYPMVFGFHEPNIDHPLLNARIETADTEAAVERMSGNAQMCHPGQLLFRMGAFNKTGWQKIHRRQVYDADLWFFPGMMSVSGSG